MSLPLQAGSAVSPELLLVLGIAVVLFLVNLGVSAWIYRDAKRRNDPNAFVWGAGAFLGVFLGGIGGIAVWALYFVMRNENGAGAPSVREET